MRRLLGTTLLLALAAPVPGAEPPRVTYFAESLLSICDLAVLGRVQRRSSFPGGFTLTTLAVAETLLGESPGPRLALSSPDPAYHGEPGRRIAVFLKRSADGGGWDTLERFLVEDDEGNARLRMARAYIALEAIASRETRVERTRALHLANLTTGDDWSRANAIRELTWFTEHWARTFRPEERDRLDEAREGMRDSTLREMLTLSLARVDEALGPRAVARAAPSPRDREETYAGALEAMRRATKAEDRASRLLALARERPARIRADLAAFLDDEAPEVRRIAAYALGESECAAAAGALLGVLARPGEDEQVRRDAVRTLGILRHAAAVPALAALLEKDAALVESAALALARIGTPEAAGALAALGPRAGPDVLRRLDFFASDGFRRQEEILARLRRARLEADR